MFIVACNVRLHHLDFMLNIWDVSLHGEMQATLTGTDWEDSG